MMETLVLHANPLAQWHALVSEAQHHSSILLSEELESYLVFLLMRYNEKPELAQSVLAVEFLKSLELIGKDKELSLRDVGDKCLLFAGLFPGVARKKRVRISYFVNLGQSAYHSLADSKEQGFSDLYSKLSNHFVGLMDILHAMRTVREEHSFLDLLSAEELWNDTKSVSAFKTLKKQSLFPMFPGFISPSTNKH